MIQLYTENTVCKYFVSVINGMEKRENNDFYKCICKWYIEFSESEEQQKEKEKNYGHSEISNRWNIGIQ